jgi:hypothetical protein
MVLHELRTRLPVVVSGAVLAAAAMTGCGDDDSDGGSAGANTTDSATQTTGETTTEPAKDATTVSVQELLRSPRRHIGREVVVEGGVDEADVAPAMFTIGAEGESKELVVLPTVDAEVPDDINERTAVRVEGEIVNLDEDVLRSQGDFLFEDNTDKGFLEGFLADPGIAATSVEVTDRSAE